MDTQILTSSKQGLAELNAVLGELHAARSGTQQRPSAVKN